MTRLAQENYVKVGREWPLWVSSKHVVAASESGEAVRVWPQHTDPTFLGRDVRSPRGGMGVNRGYVGIPLVGGTVDLDMNNNLDSYTWRGSYDQIGVVDQMVREDPVAQAIRLAWTLPLLSVQWSVQPGGNDPRDIEIAEFVQSALFEHMKGGWQSFLEQAVQFTWRGLSVFEIVARYDRELGATVIDRLAPRLPWTIDSWEQYKDGRYGLTQFADMSDPLVGTSGSRDQYSGSVLPPDKIVNFRFQPEGDNPEPMGILRPCYGAWRQRRTYLKLEATGFERSAYGIPTCTVEPGANPGDVEQVNIILRELRSGIRSFAMFPKGFKLEMAEVPMKADAIRNARVSAGQDMARAALCQFLYTGESAGSYSLIQGQLDHYTMALQQAANSIAHTLSRGPYALVKRLVNWNFQGVKTYPYIQAGEIRVGDPKQLVEAVKSAVDAGVVTPDALIEAKVRDVLSLPQRVDSDAKPIDADPGPDLEDPAPPDVPGPAEAAPSQSSRGEEQAKQEEEALAEPRRPNARIERVRNDVYITGPGGRDLRSEERYLRFSELSGAKDAANQGFADTIEAWRDRIAPEYARELAKQDTLEEMLEVEVPQQDRLREEVEDVLRGAYEEGLRAAKNEMDRQEADVQAAEKVSPPKPAPNQPAVVVDDVDPEETIRSSAALVVKKAADRVQETTISSIQVVGVGGALPDPFDIEEAAVASILSLSIGVDFRLAQQSTNTVFGLGRMQELRSDARVKRYRYSNLEESQSCTPCEERDGETFGPNLLSVYATPADWCEAGSMCNCLILGVM